MNFNYQKGFGVTAIIVIIAVIGLGGWYVATRNDRGGETACALDAKICPDGSAVGRVAPDCSFAPCPGEAMMEEGDHNADAMMEGGEAMMKEGESMMIDYQGQVLAGNKSILLDFNQADYEKALASGKLVFLYFYANWCPTCKAEQPAFMAAFDDLDTDQVVGFRVNYKDNQTDDNETALAREFGVAYQHTKVILKDGQRIGKFPDGWNKDRYLTEINSALK